MKETASMYGLTNAQWKKAREEYRQAFGDEAERTAHPTAVKKHWLEIETPAEAPKPARIKVPKQRVARATGPRKRKEKAEVVPRPEPRQLLESAMQGVNYA